MSYQQTLLSSEGNLMMKYSLQCIMDKINNRQEAVSKTYGVCLPILEQETPLLCKLQQAPSSLGLSLFYYGF